MPTLEEFINDAKARGKTKKETMDGAERYQQKYGAFDQIAPAFEPDKILVESPTEGMEKQDKQEFEKVLTPNDTARFRARKYFESKDRASYQDDQLLDQRARREMGMADASDVDYVGVVKYLTDVTAPYTRKKQESTSVKEIGMGTGASFLESAKTLAVTGMRAIAERPGLEMFDKPSGAELSQATRELGEKLDITPESWKEARSKMQVEAGRELKGNVLEKTLQGAKQGMMLVADNAPNLVASRVNPVMGFTVMYSNEKESMYQALVGAGVNKKTAEDFSTLYGSVSAPIEYIENAGRLTAAFGKKKAVTAASRPVRKVAANMLKEMGINVGEELTQELAFNLVYNAAAIQSNEKHGTKVQAKRMTWEDVKQTAKASVQMSLVLDAIGVPTRFARGKIQTNKVAKDLQENAGVNSVKAKEVAIELSKAESQEEHDAILTELTTYLEGRQERVEAVTAQEQEIPLIPPERDELITQPDGTPFTDADFDSIAENYTEEEIADMIEGEAGEVFARAVAGDAQARGEYNRILYEDTQEQGEQQTQEEKAPSMLPGATTLAKQEILDLVEESERDFVDKRLDYMINEMEPQDMRDELARLHEAYPEIPRSVDQYIRDAVEIRVEEGIPQATADAEQQVQLEQQETEQVINDVIPQEERATPKERKESEQVRAPEDTVFLTQAEGDIIRESAGLDELAPAEKTTWEARLNNAKMMGLDKVATAVARGVIDKPRVITPDEHAAFVLRAAQIQNSIKETLKEIENGVLQGKNTETAKNILNELYAELDIITQAGDISGTKAGQALNIRRMGLKMDTYEIADVLQRARVSRGSDLTDKQLQQLTDLTNQVQEWQDKADQLQKELDEASDLDAKQLAEQVFLDEQSQVQGKRDLKKVKEDREKIKEELRKMGYRMNDITGVTAKGSALIAKLAVNYIKQGAMTLDEVVQKVQKDMPDASANDVYNALSGRHKQTKQRARSQVVKRVSELKTQAGLMAKIDDAMAGIFNEKRERAPSSPVVKKLRRQLRELQATAENTELEDKKLQKIMDKIAEVERAITEETYPKKKQTRSQSERIKEANKKLRELQRLLKTNSEIKDLETRLANNDFEGLFTPKAVQEIKSQELENALLKVHQLKKEIRNRIYSMRKMGVKDYVQETAGLMRAVKATADMSYFLRQGLIPSLGHPIIASKAFASAFKAFWSANEADRIDMALKSSDMQLQREKYGLYLSTLDESLTQREEAFMSSLADKIPTWMGGGLIRASERHMITGLNMLRSQLFDEFIQKNPNASEEAKHAYARYINIMTGRGDMKWLTTSTAFQAVMFSPKFTSSRIQAIPIAAQTVIKHKELRGEVARQWLSFVGTGLAVLALAKMNGLEVGDDPDEPNFGKIVINGRTRIDVWGGLQQPVRAFVRIAQIPIDKIRDVENKTNAWDVGTDFFKYKASPIVTTGYELLTGKDWVTNKDVEAAETLSTVAVPLIFESAYEVYKMDLEASEAAVALGGEFLGLGIQTYEKKPKKAKKTGF